MPTLSDFCASLTREQHHGDWFDPQWIGESFGEYFLLSHRPTMSEPVEVLKAGGVGAVRASIPYKSISKQKLHVSSAPTEEAFRFRAE